MELHERQAHHARELAAVGQDHVLRFWDVLTDSQRAELLDDLDRVDIGQAVAAVREHLDGSADKAVDFNQLEPASFWPAEPTGEDAETYEAARRLGGELLGAGKVAALTVAGGQGTRLGYDGPKGAFETSPIEGKPLFQLFAESIRSTGRRYGCAIRWYIMTSPINDAATKAFFETHGYFGLDTSDVVFFSARSDAGV